MLSSNYKFDHDFNWMTISCLFKDFVVSALWCRLIEEVLNTNYIVFWYAKSYIQSSIKIIPGERANHCSTETDFNKGIQERKINASSVTVVRSSVILLLPLYSILFVCQLYINFTSVDFGMLNWWLDRHRSVRYQQ